LPAVELICDTPVPEHRPRRTRTRTRRKEYDTFIPY
jgi:hypothetical protein